MSYMRHWFYLRSRPEPLRQASLLLMLAGAGALVEMIYHQQLNASLGPDLPFAGLILNAQAPSTWLASLAIALVGLAGFEWLRHRFMPIWADIQSEINAQAKQEKS